MTVLPPTPTTTWASHSRSRATPSSTSSTDGPVASLLAERAAGRTIKIRGLVFSDPDTQAATRIYVSSLQARTGWTGTRMKDREGAFLGLVMPRSEVWIDGVNQDGQGSTMSGVQLKLKFVEHPPLPMLGLVPIRVRRYVRLDKVNYGVQTAPVGPRNGLIRGLDRARD